ncbi:dihydrodipicolinate synthase family protein [Streptomyces sp. BI20]|uniref:dihydrodipicolinate synthase family protein n=1 Tax=Streptomyces sp. BI20 TaxID=3403460 RepID=UPI003C76ACB5
MSRRTHTTTERPGTTTARPEGIHVPLVTPFTAEGELAAPALEALAHRVLSQGAAGLVALGTTGEPAALDPAERRAVTLACARACREHDRSLTIGVGGGDTRAVAAGLTALAELPGLPERTAALVTVPAFTRPSPAGVLAHVRRLAAASPVPLIVYHIPYRTGLALDAETLRALLAVPGVAGMKYAAGQVDADTVALAADAPAGPSLLAGDDLLLAPLLALGARGGILASAHLATGRFAAVAEAWRTGTARTGAGTRETERALARWGATLFAEPNPAVLKGVLHARGLIPTPDVRLPLLPAAPESVASALAALARAETAGDTTDGVTDGATGDARAA